MAKAFWDAPVGRTSAPQLIEAAELGNLGTIQKLLSQGANPNDRDALGTTPLMSASRMGNAGVIELLMSSGARADCADNAGRTPLMHAAAGGMVQAVDALLQSAKCVIDHRESVGGSTALYLAARRGNAMTVRALLEAGANPNIANDEGMTPQQAARKACNVECEALLRVPDTIQEPVEDPVHLQTMELNLAVEEETKIAAHLQRACDEADAQMSELVATIEEERVAAHATLLLKVTEDEARLVRQLEEKSLQLERELEQMLVDQEEELKREERVQAEAARLIAVKQETVDQHVQKVEQSRRGEMEQRLSELEKKLQNSNTSLIEAADAEMRAEIQQEIEEEYNRQHAALLSKYAK